MPQTVLSYSLKTQSNEQLSLPGKQSTVSVTLCCTNSCPPIQTEATAYHITGPALFVLIDREMWHYEKNWENDCCEMKTDFGKRHFEIKKLKTYNKLVINSLL